MEQQGDIKVSSRVTESLKDQIKEAADPNMSIEDRMTLAHNLLIARYPSLAQVTWVRDQEPNPNEPSSGEWQRPIDETHGSILTLNPTERLAFLPAQMGLMTETFSMIAEGIGIPLETLRVHPEIHVIFSFFHEMGHARNFFTQAFKNSDSLDSAIILHREETDRELDELPLPGHAPSELFKMREGTALDAARELNKGRLEALGIKDEATLLREQQIRYRELLMEAAADEFATKALHLFWTELGLDKIISK